MTNIWYKLCMSVSIGSYNGFAPVWCQAISSTNSITSDGQKTFTDSMIQIQIPNPVCEKTKNYMWIHNYDTKMLKKNKKKTKKTFQNVNSKMVAILFRLSYC